MDLGSLTLSPTAAVILFCAACLAGFRYRRVWKEEGPRYLYWLYGSVAAIALLVLGFVPLAVPG